MGIAYDFVSTHMYPNDGMCPSKDHGLKWNADCFPALVKAAKASLPPGVPLYLTEYSVGCCGENPSSNSAAMIFRAVGALHDTVEVMSYWTFSMIFEEVSEPTDELQGTFGLLSQHGVPKPGWAAFNLLHAHAGDTVLPTVSDPAWSGGVVDTSNCTMKLLGCFADQVPNPACCSQPPVGPSCQGCGTHACKTYSFAQFNAGPEFNTPAGCMHHCASAGWDVFGLTQAECRCGMAATWQDKSMGCVLNTAANCTGPCPGGGGSATCGTQWNLRMFSMDCPDRTTAPEVVAFATMNTSDASGDAAASVSVFLSYWAEDQDQGGHASKKVELKVQLGNGGSLGGAGVPMSGQAVLFRVDPDHANAAKVWQDTMNSVSTPTVAQLAELQAAAQPSSETLAVTVDAGSGVASITVDSMPPNSAYVVTLQ